MTREIKFRAWDKKDRVIREVYGVMFKRISNKGNRGEDMVEMHCSDYEGSRAIILSHFERPASEVELMQYTGLKDKNGVEIYEGDIVELGTDWGEGKTFKVEFDDGLAQFLMINLKDSVDSNDFWSGRDKVAVIGNIYENPELVKELV